MVPRLITLGCLAFGGAGCTVKPFTYASPKGASIASLGGSLMTKSAEEYASIERPDGTKMVHHVRDKDETVVPNSYIGYKTLTGLADIANGGEQIRESNATRRAISDNSVKKADIAADVTKSTFVPPVE
jgi:hypothetical protein